MRQMKYLTNNCDITNNNTMCQCILFKIDHVCAELEDTYMMVTAHWVQSVTFVWILTRTNIRIYWFQENDTNEYLNIFV